MIKLILPINPIPAPRARTVRTRRGRSITYKEDFYVEWQEEVQYCIREILFSEEFPIFEKGVKLKVEVIFKYFLEGRKHQGDLDNYLKATFDSVKGLLFYDDLDIVEIYAKKERVKKEEDSCIILAVQKVPWLISKWENSEQFQSTMQEEI